MGAERGLGSALGSIWRKWTETADEKDGRGPQARNADQEGACEEHDQSMHMQLRDLVHEVEKMQNALRDSSKTLPDRGTKIQQRIDAYKRAIAEKGGDPNASPSDQLSKMMQNLYEGSKHSQQPRAQGSQGSRFQAAQNKNAKNAQQKQQQSFRGKSRASNDDKIPAPKPVSQRDVHRAERVAFNNPHEERKTRSEGHQVVPSPAQDRESNREHKSPVSNGNNATKKQQHQSKAVANSAKKERSGKKQNNCDSDEEAWQTPARRSPQPPRKRKRSGAPDDGKGTSDQPVEIDNDEHDHQDIEAGAGTAAADEAEYHPNDDPKRGSKRKPATRRSRGAMPVDSVESHSDLVTKAFSALPPDKVELSREDLKCIGEMEFLNDSVVDFFFLHLQHESNFCSETIARVHFFNSFFFHKLVEERKRNLTDPSNYGAAHVRKWTKNLSIANKDFIFIPIVEKLHWSLAVICYPRLLEQPSEEDSRIPPILYLDSLGITSNLSLLSKEIKPWLRQEFLTKAMADQGVDDESVIETQEWWKQSVEAKMNNLKVRRVPVPAQNNHCDCGLFVCKYAERLISGWPDMESCVKATCKDAKRKGDGEISDLLFGVGGRLTAEEVSNWRLWMRKELLRVIVQKLGEMGKEVNDTLYPLVSEAEKEFNQSEKERRDTEAAPATESKSLRAHSRARGRKKRTQNKSSDSAERGQQQKAQEKQGNIDEIQEPNEKTMDNEEAGTAGINGRQREGQAHCWNATGSDLQDHAHDDDGNNVAHSGNTGKVPSWQADGQPLPELSEEYELHAQCAAGAEQVRRQQHIIALEQRDQRSTNVDNSRLAQLPVGTHYEDIDSSDEDITNAQEKGADCQKPAECTFSCESEHANRRAVAAKTEARRSTAETSERDANAYAQVADKAHESPQYHFVYDEDMEDEKIRSAAHQHVAIEQKTSEGKENRMPMSQKNFTDGIKRGHPGCDYALADQYEEQNDQPILDIENGGPVLES